jgi:hypothetical protein
MTRKRSAATWLAASLLTIGLVASTFTSAQAETPNAAGYNTVDDVVTIPSNFWGPQTGVLYKAKDFQPNVIQPYITIDVLSNDNLGFPASAYEQRLPDFRVVQPGQYPTDSPPMPKLGAATVYGNMNAIIYTPKAQGTDTFTYEVEDVNGALHQGLVTVVNTEVEELKVKPTTSGLKFYNPNQSVTIQVAIGSLRSGVGVNDTLTVKPKGVATYSVHPYADTAKEAKKYFPTRHIEYSEFFQTVTEENVPWYTVQYLDPSKPTKPVNGSVGAVTVTTSSLGVTLSNNASTTKATYRITTKKKGAKHYKTLIRSVRAGKTLKLRLTKLASNSLVTVKVKVVQGQGMGKYKVLLKKRLA